MKNEDQELMKAAYSEMPKAFRNIIRSDLEKGKSPEVLCKDVIYSSQSKTDVYLAACYIQQIEQRAQQEPRRVR